MTENDPGGTPVTVASRSRDRDPERDRESRFALLLPGLIPGRQPRGPAGGRFLLELAGVFGLQE